MPTLKKSAPKAAKKKRMGDEMHKFKAGTLRSSSGQKVTNPKQAVAIGLSESGQSRKTSPSDGQRATKRKVYTKSDRRPRNKGRS